MTRPTAPHPKLRSRQAARVPPMRKGRWLGLAGSVLARLFGRRMPPVTGEDLGKHDHPTSTQRMGVRFTERVRDTFRFRWLRKTSGGKDK